MLAIGSPPGSMIPTPPDPSPPPPSPAPAPSAGTLGLRPGTGDRPRRYALVPCAGTGSRSGAPVPKQYVALAGRTLVAHTLAALDATPGIDETWVILSPDDDRFEAAVPADQRQSLRLRVARVGGATRAATVANGLAALADAGARPTDWVLVHDAARCLIRPAWIERLIGVCEADPVGGLLALPVADTVKQAVMPGDVEAARVAATVDRRGKWLAQTPQMFRLGRLREALTAAGDAVTDEASAIEALGDAPRLVAAPMENLKLTWPEDFALAERLLRTRGASGTGGGDAI